MRPSLVAGFALALCVQAYRDSDNVGHLTSIEDLHRDPEGPHDTGKQDKEVDSATDCHSKFQEIRNWNVEFQQIQKDILEFVRRPGSTPDKQDTFGGLVAFSGDNIQIHLGAKISFKEDFVCELKPEALRFSASPSCDAGGVHLNSSEADFMNTHRVFPMMTDTGKDVLKRELMGNDADASLEGDWTFEEGDFKIEKNGSMLALEQKFWSVNFTYSGEVEGADAKDFHHIQLAIADKECLKYKPDKCPGDFCATSDDQCKAAKDKNHAFLRLKAKPPNELVRDSSPDNKTWKKFVAHRSFTPTDVELSGFVCVNTKDSWIPIRGITFKQISGTGPSQNLAKNAVNDHGQQLFANLSHGREWLQVEHRIFASASDDKFLPPWRNALQGTVVWKKAGVCPPNYPLCMADGSCALRECQEGCEWSRAPKPTSDPDGGYNYISGYDSFGTKCDIDSAEEAKSSAAGLSALLSLVTALIYGL